MLMASRSATMTANVTSSTASPTVIAVRALSIDAPAQLRRRNEDPHHHDARLPVRSGCTSRAAGHLLGGRRLVVSDRHHMGKVERGGVATEDAAPTGVEDRQPIEGGKVMALIAVAIFPVPTLPRRSARSHWS